MNRFLSAILIIYISLLPFIISGQNHENPQIPTSTSLVFKQLITPHPSIEAEALYRYIQSISCEKILSGQMYSPSGIKDAEYIQNVTGKQPAMRGIDLMRERSNNLEINNTIEWWNKGGVPFIMWTWGAPSFGEGYDNSGKEINIDRCFEEGTPEYKSFWEELSTKANHLEKLRDANVPVIWCPFHEPNGNYFWWGKQGPVQFKKLWRTMFNYFTHERKLNNLIWVQSFSDNINKDWYPGNYYVDIIGVSSGEEVTKHRQDIFANAKKLTKTETTPVAFNQCSIIPSVDELKKTGTMWSWWMLRSNSHLQKTTPKHLFEIYNHKLVVTLDELPDIVKDYSHEGIKREFNSGIVLPFDLKGYNFGAKSGNYTIQNDRIEIVARGEGFAEKRDDGYFVFKQMTGDFDVSVQVLGLSPTHMQTSAGIMARIDLRKSSAYTYMQVFPENNPNKDNPVGCQFSFRAKRGAQTEVIIPKIQTTKNNFKVKFPNTWISFKRRRDTFISYISNDNIHWHIYSVQKQKMPKNLLVGLAISSASSEKSATAEFKLINLTWDTKIKDEKTK